LLFHQSHYQRIVSKPDNGLFRNDAGNVSGCSPVDFDSSSFNQCSFLGIYKFCSMCDNDTNHLVTLGTLMSSTQEVVITNKSSSNAASVAHSIFEKATNNPIVAAPTMACEYKLFFPSF
jgi:hypothetical protein